MASGKPTNPIKKRILDAERSRSNAFTRMAADLEHAKTIDFSTKKLKLLSAAEAIEEDLAGASQEHVDLLKSFVASYLRLPPGEQVRVGPYKGSVWHRIANRTEMPASEALRKVLRWPTSSSTKISFFTKREDGRAPMFPRFKFPRIQGKHMHVLDILRAVGGKDKGEESVAHVSLQCFVEACKSLQKDARAKDVEDAVSGLVSLHEQP